MPFTDDQHINATEKMHRLVQIIRLQQRVQGCFSSINLRIDIHYLINDIRVYKNRIRDHDTQYFREYQVVQESETDRECN